MILLDTHIWVWWVQGDRRLTQHHQDCIQQQTDGLGLSIFSCWEVAKLVEVNRLVLPRSVDEWFEVALAYPRVQLLSLTLPIIIQSTQLTGFHRDPADQIIVATAIVHGMSILTADEKVLNYVGVTAL
jgi:PIN domain nuclease of toxin-antitoxin system